MNRCQYIYKSGPNMKFPCNEESQDGDRCQLHNEIGFRLSERGLKDIVKNGIGDDYDELINWIRDYSEEFEIDTNCSNETCLEIFLEHMNELDRALAQ